MTDLEVSFDVTSGFTALEAPDKLPTIFNGDKTVIYGIFRSKAASDLPLEAGVSGTASLKGKILGVSFEHTIPFEIPPPSDSPDSDSFQVAVVHHLAAKSLIRDWEHKEGWASTASESECKQEIIRVSMESSVVSAHTAYIAVDEEQDKLIEGAIQTWDLSATMIASEGGWGYGQFPQYQSASYMACSGGGMLFGGPPLPASAFSAAPQSYGMSFGGAPPPPTVLCGAPPPPGGDGGGLFGGPPAPMMSFGAPPPPGGGGGLLGGPPPPPAPMMSFGAPPPPPPTGARYSRSAAPPPPAFAAGPPHYHGGVSSFDSVQMKSRSAMSMGSDSIRSKLSSELTQLISLQQAEGFWNLDKVSSFMKKPISSPISGVDSTVWATVVALVLLESRFSQQQDEWELVAMKAETWLSMQSLPAGFDAQKLKEEAKKLI